ncbi:hypothetical protein RRG08_019601 [Elysia crispata]|uniref:Uncharacterized protein n=1 Tax=Elysia crispata TaxID=231223 RepID=A0AAE1AXY3_9GAST|nr:hypothetical protein RRG08_019601 [Elysia crispata]
MVPPLALAVPMILAHQSSLAKWPRLLWRKNVGHVVAADRLNRRAHPRAPPFLSTTVHARRRDPMQISGSLSSLQIGFLLRKIASKPHEIDHNVEESLKSGADK